MAWLGWMGNSAFSTFSTHTFLYEILMTIIFSPAFLQLHSFPFLNGFLMNKHKFNFPLNAASLLFQLLQTHTQQLRKESCL